MKIGKTCAPITVFYVSYSTVVLYVGIMKVRGFWPQIITPKPAF